MSPSLKDGDYILSIKTKPQSLKLGFIYVIDHSDLGRIVKRLERIEKNMCFFYGDNKSSTPASILGLVSKERVVGKAILAFTKSGIRKL